MSHNLRRGFLGLFKGEPLPEPEEAPMPPDPEWDELLAWAQVSRPVVARAAEGSEAEEQEWAVRIEAARQRARQRAEAEAADEAEWAAAIEGARQLTGRTEDAEWQAAIQRAKAGNA